MLPLSALPRRRRGVIAKREQGIESLQELAVALWGARVHIEILTELELHKDPRANRVFHLLEEDLAGWDYQLQHMCGLIDSCAGNEVLRALVDAGLENVTRIGLLEELVGDDTALLRRLLEDNRSKRAREASSANA